MSTPPQNPTGHARVTTAQLSIYRILLDQPPGTRISAPALATAANTSVTATEQTLHRLVERGYAGRAVMRSLNRTGRWTYWLTTSGRTATRALLDSRRPARTRPGEPTARHR